MNMFADLKTDNTVEEEVDSVGGGYSPVDSGAYTLTIKQAYGGAAASGAKNLTITAQTEDGKEIRQTIYLTSGTAKGAKNYYERDGKRHYLPGFLLANSLCLLTTGKEIAELETEEKTIKLYSSELGKETNTKVPMLMDLVGKTVIAGIIKQVVDKNVKNDDGDYVPSGETREENEIDKFFCDRDDHRGLTVTEIKAGNSDVVFLNTWKEKWEGQVRDKTAKDKGNAGKAGVPSNAGGTDSKPKNSLFS